MPTPIRAFLDVAEKHGIDPSDPTAVQNWFIEVLPYLPTEQVEKILEDLLSRDATDSDAPIDRCYPQNVALPSLEKSPQAPAPLLSACWTELLPTLLKRLRTRH